MSNLSFNSAEHRYLDGERELISVTRLLAATGLTKDLAFLGLDPIYRNRGTAVHQIFELIDKSEYDEAETSEELRPYAAQIAAFKRDTAFHGRLWESPLANRRMRYAGTLDCIGEVGEEIWLIDVKTGVLQICGVATQLAAYQELVLNGEAINAVDSDFLLWAKDNQSRIRRKSLNVRGDDGPWTLRSHDEPQWPALWRGAVAVYSARKEYGMLTK